MTVHILERPRVLAKLRTEFKAALPNPNEPLSIKDTEQLPYLSAVITEGMRLAMGTSQRQTRINPNEVLTFNDGNKQWSIPPGVSSQAQSLFPDTSLSGQTTSSLSNRHQTPIGMRETLIHLQPDIIVKSTEFRPERLIENPMNSRLEV